MIGSAKMFSPEDSFWSKESFQDGSENHLHRLLGQIRDPDHVEMSEESGSHSIPTTSWGSTGTHKLGVLYLLKYQLLSIVESSLSQWSVSTTRKEAEIHKYPTEAYSHHQ